MTIARRLAAGALGLSLLAVPTLASAAEPDTACPPNDKNCRFYQFDTTAFDSDRKGPKLVAFGGKERVKFGALLTLKSPRFLDRSLESAKQSVFR